MFEHVVFTASLLFAVLTVVWLFLTQRFFTDLKHEHPSLFAQLGSPSLLQLAGRSMSHDLRILKFITNAGAGHALNADLASRLRFLRLYFFVTIAVFLVMMSGAAIANVA